MADKKKPEGPQVTEDLEFQKKEWRTGRIGWVVLGTILLLGLLGVFGDSGLLNTTTTGEQGQGFWIEHERFIRNLAPTTLTLFIAPDQITGEELRVWFPQDYIGEFEIESIEPEPEQVTATGGGQEYTFNVREPGETVSIRFYLEAEKMGNYSADVVLNDGPTLPIRQFSYP